MASGGRSRTSNMDEAHPSINHSRDRVSPTKIYNPNLQTKTTNPVTNQCRTVSRKRRLVCANLEAQTGIIARRAEHRIHLKSELVYNDPEVDTETVRPRHDFDQYCMDLHEALSTSPEDATESQRASQLIELSAQPTPNMRGGAHSEMRQKLKLNKKLEGQPQDGGEIIMLDLNHANAFQGNTELDGLTIDNQEGTVTNIQNETSGGDERASNNQETPRGTSQDKPEENPDDQNCKRSPGNLWLSIDHQSESLLNRYIRIKGIKRRVNDLSLNDLKSLVKKLDEHIQFYRLRPASEYSALTYARWAEFDGNQVPLMGRIRIHMALIINDRASL
ncbi:hypothetical protein V2W45_1465909 [Cenococcum geophilum]